MLFGNFYPFTTESIFCCTADAKEGMITMKTRRLLAALLTLAMVLGFAPTVAIADDTPTLTLKSILDNGDKSFTENVYGQVTAGTDEEHYVYIFGNRGKWEEPYTFYLCGRGC